MSLERIEMTIDAEQKYIQIPGNHIHLITSVQTASGSKKRLVFSTEDGQRVVLEPGLGATLQESFKGVYVEHDVTNLDGAGPGAFVCYIGAGELHDNRFLQNDSGVVSKIKEPTVVTRVRTEILSTGASQLILFADTKRVGAYLSAVGGDIYVGHNGNTTAANNGFQGMLVKEGERVWWPGTSAVYAAASATGRYCTAIEYEHAPE